MSNSNIMNVTFRTDGVDGSETGFLAVWTATTEPETYPTFDGCGSCSFPFSFNGRLFDTCTSIDGDQPWCSLDVPPPIDLPPVDEGNHIITIKSYCSDSDSTCPQTPQMSVHPNNEPGNCCKFSNVGNFFLINPFHKIVEYQTEEITEYLAVVQLKLENIPGRLELTIKI